MNYDRRSHTLSESLERFVKIDTAGLRWGLKICISNMLPANYMLLAHTWRTNELRKLGKKAKRVKEKKKFQRRTQKFHDSAVTASLGPKITTHPPTPKKRQSGIFPLLKL